jgi:hypothetical protein
MHWDRCERTAMLCLQRSEPTNLHRSMQCKQRACSRFQLRTCSTSSVEESSAMTVTGHVQNACNNNPWRLTKFAHGTVPTDQHNSAPSLFAQQ